MSLRLRFLSAAKEKRAPFSLTKRGLSRADGELEAERPYDARQPVQCRIPFRPKCLVHRLPADARLTCDLGHPASARHVSEGCRNQSRVAVLEGGLKAFPQILCGLQMLGGIPGKCFKSHLCLPSPAL